MDTIPLAIDSLPRDARVLVGNSVYEDATLTINNGVLYIEFDAEDLDEIAVDLWALRPRSD